MKSITWQSEVREVKDLITYKENPRKISKQSLEKLKERISERGFHAVIVIDSDNTILSGNQRKKALEELGIKQVQVMFPDRKLTDDEKIKISLESNRNDGEWDFDLLKSFDFKLLTDIGFSDIELKFWDKELEVKEEDFDVEKELGKIKTATTKAGDLIFLGNHRLICGDSTDESVLKKLFGNDKASMIYSDPVYNIKIDYSKGIGGKQSYGGNVNDNRSYAEYEEFLNKSLKNGLAVSNENAHVFYWCDQVYIGLVQELYRKLGVNNKRVCLWIKNGHNPTPGVAFNKCYEPCVYGVRGKPYMNDDIQNLNEVMNKDVTGGNNMLDEIDVWLMKRLSGKDYEHATSKPPTLHEKAIRRCTKPNDIILDSFSGSASTLIAGEMLKRRVYAVELEPIFCDLAIKRFEKLTGIKANIIRNNEEV
jgi:DNA modification methylase